MIFLDTADIKKISYFNEIGIIDGVTTNPSIMKKNGIRDPEEFVKTLLDENFRYPISLEVTNNDSIKSMVSQARQLSRLADTVNVKIPIHGPNGELFNLNVIKILADEGIKVNVTAMMNAQQCYIAAKLGARYVSLFGGRVNDIGYSAVDEIKKTRKLLDTCEPLYKIVDIIIGSVREPSNIVEWLYAGANIITVPPDILEKLIVHPYTKETVQTFLKDANG